jgi:hypothetical protein
MQQQNTSYNQEPQATGRRRNHGRRPNSTAAAKAYASESDMAGDLQFQFDMGQSNGPLTPDKVNSYSPGPSSTPGQAKPRQRQQNKARGAKHQSTSPGPPKPGGRTPPESVTAVKPNASAAAFAGATFHASPAPSSLPIPSFLTRASVGSPAHRSAARGTSEEPSPPVTDSEAPTPVTRPTVSLAPREESPLDFFFRADRAEKEKARRASSANGLVTAPGPFSPPPQGPSATRGPARVSKEPFSEPPRRLGVQRLASSGISTSELDGDPSSSMGPAFSTPYQDRIRAARSAEKHSALQQPLQTQSPQQTPTTQQTSSDKAEALKRYLFAAPTNRGQTLGTAPNKVAAGEEINKMPSSSGMQSSQPMAIPITNAATRAASTDAAQMRQMEDHLRAVLNLGPAAKQDPIPSPSNSRPTQNFH